MALNGWHRLGIVMAIGWVIGVISFAMLEHNGTQGELRDGFFTCGDPIRPPMPPTLRYWDRDCGLFPRKWVATDLFDGLPPYQRHLNFSRFLLVLLGPIVFVSLCIAAVCWIASGFRLEAMKSDGSEPKAASRPQLAAQSELPSLSHTDRWLHQLRRRWARNVAIGGGALAALSIVPLLSTSDASSTALMLVGLAVVALGTAGTGYVCGRWARYSLKAPFLLSPTSAVTRIMPNWLTGAILLGAIVLASDVLFGWRRTDLKRRSGAGRGGSRIELDAMPSAHGRQPLLV